MMPGVGLLSSGACAVQVRMHMVHVVHVRCRHMDHPPMPPDVVQVLKGRCGATRWSTAHGSQERAQAGPERRALAEEAGISRLLEKEPNILVAG